MTDKVTIKQIKDRNMLRFFAELNFIFRSRVVTEFFHDSNTIFSVNELVRTENAVPIWEAMVIMPIILVPYVSPITILITPLNIVLETFPNQTLEKWLRRDGKTLKEMNSISTRGIIMNINFKAVAKFIKIVNVKNTV